MTGGRTAHKGCECASGTEGGRSCPGGCARLRGDSTAALGIYPARAVTESATPPRKSRRFKPLGRHPKPLTSTPPTRG